jgi:hypothetical protein
MKTTWAKGWLFLVMAVALSDALAMADEANYGLPLIQARFDQLIPTSYPAMRPGFDRLIQTSQPVIHPGVAQVPITESLVRPLDQPLLIVNGNGRSYPRSERRSEVTLEARQKSARPHVPPRRTAEIRPRVSY